MILWTMLPVPPLPGLRFGPTSITRRRGCKVERYVCLDTGRIFVYVERPGLGRCTWFAGEGA